LRSGKKDACAGRAEDTGTVMVGSERRVADVYPLRSVKIGLEELHQFRLLALPVCDVLNRAPSPILYTPTVPAPVSGGRSRKGKGEVPVVNAEAG
jgi:hypothetical protein